jgi:hypothetical protein
LTPDDLQLCSSQGWRERRIEVFHGTVVGCVLVTGRRPKRAGWVQSVAEQPVWLSCLHCSGGVPMRIVAPACGDPAIRGGADAGGRRTRRQLS